MIEIWVEFARFKITNQRITDQVGTIIMKGWNYTNKLQVGITPTNLLGNISTVTETLNTETFNQKETLSNSD